jgi:sugar phosphate isomerase/epimerase
MKKCFTINQMRKRENFIDYMRLLENDIYQGIELFYPYNQSNEQIKQYTTSVKEIMEKYPSVELVLHLPHSIYNGLCLDEHLNAGSKEIMMAGMKFASGFNIKKLTLHLGHVDKNVNREIYYDKLVPILRELCDYADKFNQIIMIENMPGSNEFGYSPEEILKLIKLVNKNNLKFIFDTGHAHVSEFDDFSYLYLLKDYLYHIHYSDNDGSRDAHTRVHSGTYDFETHFRILKEINYQELHCMEILHQNADDLIIIANDVKEYEE